jgi:hypothetical protein
LLKRRWSGSTFNATDSITRRQQNRATVQQTAADLIADMQVSGFQNGLW